MGFAFTTDDIYHKNKTAKHFAIPIAYTSVLIHTEEKMLHQAWNRAFCFTWNMIRSMGKTSVKRTSPTVGKKKGTDFWPMLDLFRRIVPRETNCLRWESRRRSSRCKKRGVWSRISPLLRRLRQNCFTWNVIGPMGRTSVKRMPPTVGQKGRNGLLTDARSVSGELFHAKQMAWGGNCGADYCIVRKGEYDCEYALYCGGWGKIVSRETLWSGFEANISDKTLDHTAREGKKWSFDTHLRCFAWNHPAF